MIRPPAFSLALFLALTLVIPRAPAADDLKVIEAEDAAKDALPVYRDPTASGSKSVVLFLSKERAGAGLKLNPTFPPGAYEVTAWVTAKPVELMHQMSLRFEAGGEARTMTSAWFDDSGTYVPVRIRIVHPGGPLKMSLAGSASTGFDGMRATQAEDEQKAEKDMRSKMMNTDLTFDDRKKETKGEDEDLAATMLEGAALITSINFYDMYAACDRIEVRKVSDLPARVTRLWVDKIHYLPGEEAKGEVEAEAVTAPGDYTLAVDEIWESDTHRTIFEKDVALTPKAQSFAFTFKISDVEFGRELLATLRAKGGRSEVTAARLSDRERSFPGGRSEYFGVSRNVYRIGITAEPGPQNTQTFTREQALRNALANKAAYANYFERFAWAPCDYSDLAPETEKFWSGQTQYPGSITGMKGLIEEAHKVGIKAITYGKSCAGGIEGFKTFQRHPEFFGLNYGAGIVTEAMGTFLLERMLAWEYEGNWQDWQSIWCNWETNDGTVDFGADAIMKGVEMFGWDGVRWDGHFVGKMARFKKRVNAVYPGFLHAYNIAFANPGSPLFMPSAPVDDFHECAKDHGMMMDESVRDYSHSNFSYGRPEVFYQAICREGDYMKRINGLPLLITFDMATTLDRIYNCLMGLAGGERYTYLITPGEWPFGSLAKWLTRYSAFVWDDTKRIQEPGKAITVAAPGLKADQKYPLLWKESCWVRDVGPGRKQVLVNIINPPRYPAFSDRTQAPALSYTNVTVELKIPEGATVTGGLHLSPDLVEGQEVLQAQVDAGACRVVLPRVHTWSIAVFEVAAKSGKFEAEPYALTTPIEDAAAQLKKAEGEAEAKRQTEAAAKAGLKATPTTAPRESRWTDYALGTNFDAEDEARPETAKQLDEIMKRPKSPALVRNGIMDVHHCRGIFSWLNNVQAAMGAIGAGNYTVSWVDRHYGRKTGQPPITLDEFVDTYDQLFAHDVLIMDNVHADDEGLLRRIMVKDFVQAGGGLLVFGGQFNVSCGMDQSTWTEALMPVRIAGYRQFATNTATGFRLQAADPSFFPKKIEWEKAPYAFYVDTSPLKDNAKVLLKAGDHPAIVGGTFGKGRVVVVLMNQHGDPAQGLQPYWEWRQWPEIVGACIRWLGEGYEQKTAVETIVRKKDPNEVDPVALAMEAAVNSLDGFTQKLRSACKNVVDKNSAEALLQCALDNADSIKDFDVLQAVVTAVEPFVDASFAPIAQKIVDQQKDLGPIKATALRIIGAAKDETKFQYVARSLDDANPEVKRAAILALGALGTPDAVKELKAYIEKKGDYLFLAALLLAEQKVPDGLKDALPLYAAHVKHVRDLKCEHFSRHNDLYGGVSFKLTPQARIKLTKEFEQFKKREAMERSDENRFEAYTRQLPATQVTEAMDVFAATESMNLVPVAYSVVGRLPDQEFKRLAPKLKTAKLEQIRVLAEQ